MTSFLFPLALPSPSADTQYLLTFAGLLIVGVVISTLTARAREQADAAMQRETETAALYELSRDLAAALGRDDILQTVTQHVEHTFGRDVAILLPSESGVDRLESLRPAPALSCRKMSWP